MIKMNWKIRWNLVSGYNEEQYWNRFSFLIHVMLKVCVYNRTVSKVDDFMANEGKGRRVIGAHSLSELVE